MSSGTITGPAAGLKRRAVEGGVLTAGGQALKVLLDATTLIVLAQYLTRDDFGLVAIALSIQFVLRLTQDSGFSDALIQRRDLEPAHLDSVLWVTGGISLVSSLALVALADPIARGFERPELRGVLLATVASLVAIWAGGVPRAKLRREMRFRRVVWIDLSSAALGAGVAMSAAMQGYGLWSLVARMLVVPATAAALGFALSGYRPRAALRWRAVRELWSFGGFVFLSALAGFGASQLDAPIIAGTVGISAAGAFFLARQLALGIVQEIANSAARVIFPVFSSLQEQPDTIGAGYRKTIHAMALVTFPISAALVGLSPEGVPLVLGAQWAPAIPLLQVLSLHVVLVCFNYPAAQVLNARGRSGVTFALAALRGVATLIAFWVGTRWGALGVAVAWTVVRGVTGPPVLVVAAREMRIGVPRLLSAAAVPAAAAVAGVLAARGVAWLARDAAAASLSGLTLEAAALAATYLLVCVRLGRRDLRELCSDLGEVRHG